MLESLGPVAAVKQNPCGLRGFRRLPVVALVSQLGAGPSLRIATWVAGWSLQRTAAQMRLACGLLWLVQPTGLVVMMAGSWRKGLSRKEAGWASSSTREHSQVTLLARRRQWSRQQTAATAAGYTTCPARGKLQLRSMCASQSRSIVGCPVSCRSVQRAAELMQCLCSGVPELSHHGRVYGLAQHIEGPLQWAPSKL